MKSQRTKKASCSDIKLFYIYTMADSPHEDLHYRNVLLSVGGISNRLSKVGSPHFCQTRSKCHLVLFHF